MRSICSALAGGSAPPAGAGRRRGAGPQPCVHDQAGVARLADLEAGDRGALAQPLGQRAFSPDRHRPAAPARLERLGVRRAVRALLRVVVPAPARLSPEAFRGDHPRLQRARLPARLAEGQLGEGLRHLEADVYAHEVHELEGAHAKAAAQATDAVDLLRACRRLGQKAKRLGAEGPPAAVDQEAGAVGGQDHLLAHGLAGRAGQFERPLARLVGPDDLEQRHQRRRVEEVHAHHVLGLGRGAGQRGDRDRRGVRGQHGLGPADLGQAREQLALELGPLRRGLDNQLAGREPVEGVHRLQQSSRLLADPSLLHPAGQSPAHPVGAPLEGVGLRVVQPRADPGGAAELRDPRAHRAGAHHADDPGCRAHRPRNSGLRFSMKAVIPSTRSSVAIASS